MDYFLKLVHVLFLNRSRKQSSNQMVGSTQQQQEHTNISQHARTQARTQTQTQTHTRKRKRKRQSTRTHAHAKQAGKAGRQSRTVRTQVENENERAGKIRSLYHPPERDGSVRAVKGGNRTAFCGNSNSNTNSNSNGHIGGQQQQKPKKGGGGDCGREMFCIESV